MNRFASLSVTSNASTKNIDANDTKDQMANTEYLNDIFRNLFKEEVSSRL